MSLGVSSGTAPSSRESCRRRRRRTRRGLREVPGTGGRERCTWEDRASHIGVRRPKTSGVINATVRGRRYRGSRGGTPGSTADGPRHGSERGDGNPSRRYRGTGGTWARGTNSATYRRTYRRTGALEGRDHPPGLPLSALPGGGREGGDRDVRVGSPVRGGPRRAGSHRKGFRKTFSPGQEPRITGISRGSRSRPPGHTGALAGGGRPPWESCRRPSGGQKANLERSSTAARPPGGRSRGTGRSSRGGGEVADLLDGPRTGRGEPGGAA